MRRLTVLYDADCALCRRARAWLERQSQYVPLVFVAAGSEDARGMFPSLDHPSTLAELTVIADTGDVYRGPKAWIICLWALREHRSTAVSMRAPGAWWAAKSFIRQVSKHRHRRPCFDRGSAARDIDDADRNIARLVDSPCEDVADG